MTRKAGATWAIASEDEWYKAAYHKNDGVTGNYFDYPTSTDAMPSNDLTDPDDAGNNATFYDGGFTIGSPYYRTEVGAHENSESPYGTFDQGGNVWEWNETVLYSSSRGCRGAAFDEYDTGDYGVYLRAADLNGTTPAYEFFTVGFRVVEVPEPSTLLMLIVGGIASLRTRQCLRDNGQRAA